MRRRDAKKIAKAAKGGHSFKETGDQYRSAKGKGDTLKAGKHEPYAYIRLNPAMLNQRKKS